MNSSNVVIENALAGANAEQPSRWRGNLEVVRRDAIEGWAQDEVDPTHPLRLRIFDNKVPLGEVLADRYRPDLEAAGVGNGYHAFSLLPPGGLAPDIRHLIEVQRADDGRPLRNSPYVLEVSARDLTKQAFNAMPAAWAGKLETVTRERLEGWAWDERTHEAPVALVVLDNGEVIARVLANRYRSDLARAGIGSGRHAFAVHLPGGLSPLVRHVIQVLGEADGCEMPTSPVIIEATTVFDAALEQVIKASVAALATSEDRDRVLGFLATTTNQVLQQGADASAGREARIIHRQFERRWGNAQTDERAQAAASTPSSASPRLRALVVDDHWPPPGRAGAAILSRMQALLTLNYEVSFVAAEELDAPSDAAAALEALGIEACAAPYYASVEEVLRRQRGGFDLIYLQRLSNASRYLTLARQSGARTRIVYGVDELSHLRLARRAKVEARPELLALSYKMRFAECTAAGAADLVITHSLVEAAWLRHAVKGVNVHVVPPLVPWRPAQTAWVERSGIALLGEFERAADVDAAHYFVREVMPRLWHVNPEIGCIIAGNSLPPEIERLADSRVTIKTGLTDFNPVLDRVRLTVATHRFGAGVNTAVLESLAAGVACIMTTVAAEGLGLPGALALIGANADAFTALVLHHYDNEQKAAELVLVMQEFITSSYNADAVTEKLKLAIQGPRSMVDAQANAGSASAAS